MTEFQIKLAGIPMRIRAIYPQTEVFCRAYLTQETPLFEIAMKREDLDHIRKVSEENAAREGREPEAAGDPYLEALALYDRITEELLSYGVLLFHSCAVAAGGKAYLFTAKTGVGKTTHARLWLKNIPGCHIINGDKPLLRFTDEGVSVCGTPWQGKENYGTNEILPLKAICLLERGAENRITPVGFHEAFSVLLKQSHHPGGSAGLPASIKLLEQLQQIPMYRMQCRMDDAAAWTAYRGMTE